MAKSKIKDCWRYEIVYDRYNQFFFMAEVFYDKKGKPHAWCKAELIGDDLKELGKEIDRFYRTYINQTKIKRIDMRGNFV